MAEHLEKADIDTGRSGLPCRFAGCAVFVRTVRDMSDPAAFLAKCAERTAHELTHGYVHAQPAPRRRNPQWGYDWSSAVRRRAVV